MRLLKTGPYVPGDEKLEVIQIWGEDIPPYAILSHTWATDPDDEVLLSDVRLGICSSKPAYVKLKKAMERAKFDGYPWLWIDSCCIDQSSNVELSEAINSMYKYYKMSAKCYSYLADVRSEVPGEDFKKARWWTRGWTLQELIAPLKMEFFNAEWVSLGYKDSLHELITEITGIDLDYLNGTFPVERASIAKRMSWAASRETRREEDIAYSLIGIFDVNMPMLYGEGANRAFVRLQEEIVKSTEDQSIFAWVKLADSPERPDGCHGLFADSPRDFKYTGKIIPYSEAADYNPCSMTARGLNIMLPLTRKDDGTVIAALHCPPSDRGLNDWLAVYLKPLRIGTNQYARIHCDKLASVSEIADARPIYVRQNFPNYEMQTIYPYHYFQLRSFVCHSEHDDLLKYTIIQYRCGEPTTQMRTLPLSPPKPWFWGPHTYQISKTAGSLTAALVIRRSFDQEAFILMLGTISAYEVGAAVCEGNMLGSLKRLQDDFHPQRPGEYMNLKLHSVRVSIEESVRADEKIYFVDLDIYARPKPPTAEELLQDAVHFFVGGHKPATKTRLRDKVRSLIP